MILNIDLPKIEKITEDGKLHRVNGPAMTQTQIIEDGIKYTVTTYSNHDVVYTLHNEFHRISGPAIFYDNREKYWYFHDQKHRADGPAVIYADGRKEWWYQGERIKVRSQKAFKKWLSLKAFT